MSWWTKIQGVVKKHDGRRPKTEAISALSAARWSGVPFSDLGLYKKDPTQFPDTRDELPALVERTEQRRTRK